MKGSTSIDQIAALPFFPNFDSSNRVFGYCLPFLPDFLADHTLLGETKKEKLDEVLQRFEHFILGLRKYRQTAFSLRFISEPETGSIRTYIFGRVLSDQNTSNYLASQAYSDLQTHLLGFGFTPQPIWDGPPAHASTAPTNFHNQPQTKLAIVEIRQRETIVPLHTINKDAYTIHPYWGPEGSCLEPFEAMLRQSAPVAICIYLEPTELSEKELYSLSEASAIAQTVADINIQTYSESSINRHRDPGAELVSNIYREYLKTLTDPFIALAQIVSPDPNAAWTIARSYASSITNTNANQKTMRVVDLPTGSDILVPQNNHDADLAKQTFSTLIWNPWGNSKAPNHKERLPYLVGARGASTIFRFPISVNAGVPGIRVRQMPPDFEPGGRPNQIKENEILLGNLERGGASAININDLSRHTLITGFTGSGKTNTIFTILDQIWHQHKIPFLVIESAKKEYRQLLVSERFSDLLIFTLGDETTSPFRFNPFELLPEVRLEAHLNRLQACFDAALPQFGILPSIVAESLENIYKRLGWKLTDHASESENKLFPTMRDLFSEVIRVTEKRGYVGEISNNIRAAAAGRIGNLLRGSRGRMFNCQRSLPAGEVFSRPVILELNDLNEDDKSLIMMFLLTWLREYRELHISKGLSHLTIVEEAHNVLSNVHSIGSSEIAADTKAKAVLAFSNMLSEIRSYGEGIIISDQSPEKLAPDAIRNTNLQISHQLRDTRDREAIARAMIMDTTQQEYLSKLRIGEAAIFYTGLEKATFIKIPEYTATTCMQQPPDNQTVKNWMSNSHPLIASTALPFDGCRFCKSQCKYYDAIEPLTFVKSNHEIFIKALKNFEKLPQPEYWPENWLFVSKVCKAIVEQAGLADDLDAAYCFLCQEIDFAFTQHMRISFENAFKALEGYRDGS